MIYPVNLSNARNSLKEETNSSSYIDKLASGNGTTGAAAAACRGSELQLQSFLRSREEKRLEEERRKEVLAEVACCSMLWQPKYFLLKVASTDG